MERTNVPFAPWHVVDGTDIRQAELAVLKLLTGGIDGAVKGAAVRPQPLEEAFPMKKAGCWQRWTWVRRFPKRI